MTTSDRPTLPIAPRPARSRPGSPGTSIGNHPAGWTPPPDRTTPPDTDTVGTRRCRACGRTRPIPDLLVVTRCDDPDVVTWVCRPGLRRFTDPECFRSVGPRDVETDLRCRRRHERRAVRRDEPVDDPHARQHRRSDRPGWGDLWENIVCPRPVAGSRMHGSSQMKKSVPSTMPAPVTLAAGAGRPLIPPVPRGLKASGRALWRDLQAGFALDEPHQKVVLRIACEAQRPARGGSGAARCGRPHRLERIGRPQGSSRDRGRARQPTRTAPRDPRAPARRVRTLHPARVVALAGPTVGSSGGDPYDRTPHPGGPGPRARDDPDVLARPPPSRWFWAADWDEREASLRADWDEHREAALRASPVDERPWAFWWFDRPAEDTLPGPRRDALVAAGELSPARAELMAQCHEWARLGAIARAAAASKEA